jgi:addiction module HigA family antidote
MMTLEDIQLEREHISPPGDTLLETLEYIGMQQNELAERMNKNIKNINRIIAGEEAITEKTAVQLEEILGIPASFWLNRENNYRQDLAQLDAMEKYLHEVEWLKRFPIAKMKKLGWLPDIKEKPMLIKKLLQFFSVSSMEIWEDIYLNKVHSIAFKRSLKHANEPEAVSVWLRQGERQVDEIKDLQPYNEKAFRKLLKELKPLIRNHPDDLFQQLQSKCAAAGVAVVFTTNLPKAPINGSTRWIKKGVPLIQLSGRYKTNDIFWFTFYHEAAHILLHGKTDIFLENLAGCENDPQKEEEADRFAERSLISDAQYNRLLKENELTKNVILQFAEQFDTHPAILVGRLQHDEVFPRWHMNELKERVG